ncbi:unnamed protein product [Soboliphyme baturini]|uniref:GLOBIN domain-containing protein n=1 Tax=Soboliphyme baturini TaxID=241478 RepID=A0A183IHG0_9BILA|nr:unnamed protein product [Soboliphyme baturini]
MYTQSKFCDEEKAGRDAVSGVDAWENTPDGSDFLSHFSLREKELLSVSMKKLEQLEEDNAVKIFIRLFQENPAYKSLFPKLRFMGDADIVNSTALVAHTQLILKMIKTFINGFQNESTCAVVLKRAETAHRKFDIKPSQVSTLFPILMEILDISHNETQAAWKKLFETFSIRIEKMKLYSM